MINTNQVLFEIEPAVREWIRTAILTLTAPDALSGAFAPSPHELGGDHHAGTLSDDQAPQFLMLDGSRELTGDLAVASGVLLDGVDLGLFKAAFDAHDAADAVTAHGSVGAHTHQSNGQGGLLDHGLALSGLGDDDHTQYAAAVGAAFTRNAKGVDPAINQTWTGAHIFQNTLVSQHHNPQSNDQYDLGQTNLRWRQIFASELETILLKYGAVIAVDGKIILAKQNGSFDADVSSGATSLDFGQAMTTGDFIYVAGNNAVEYITIGTLVSGTTYNVTRNVDGSGANEWKAGHAWIAFGQDGDLRIEICGGSANEPKIALMQQGFAYNNVEDLVSITSTGITIEGDTAFDRSRAYKFLANGNNIGGLAGYYNIGPNINTLALNMEAVSGYTSWLDITSNIHSASSGRVRLSAEHPSKTARLDLNASSTVRTATFSVDKLTLDALMALGGTAFPASPADNDLYYRTDRDLLYFYNSGLAVWLTVHEYQISQPDQRIPDGTLTSVNITATTSGTEQTIWLSPLQGTYKTLVTGIWFNITKAGTHDGSNNFTVSLKAFDYSAAATTLTTWTTNNRSTRFEETYGTVLNTDGTSGASPNRVVLRIFKTGTPGNLNMGTILKYRLVG